MPKTKLNIHHESKITVNLPNTGRAVISTPLKFFGVREDFKHSNRPNNILNRDYPKLSSVES
jgi:hypothetical protein